MGALKKVRFTTRSLHNAAHSMHAHLARPNVVILTHNVIIHQDHYQCVVTTFVTDITAGMNASDYVPA